MKILRVGDPHIKVSNLEEADRLMNYVLEMATLHNVDRIELLGDLFHTHAIIRVEVLNFWLHWLDVLSDGFDTVVIVGNHDQSGDYAGDVHALEVFKRINKNRLTIVDKPDKTGPFGYMPYVHSEADFLKQANELYDMGARVLVCHATFNGAKYDNGMYAPGGFSLENLKFDTVISGHIHTRQRFGKAIYPGTAKWDTNSDANEEKGLWLVDHAENGSIVSEQFLDTKEVCTPIITLQWTEGEAQPEIPKGRVTLELIGSSEWIKKQKEKLKGQCGLKSKTTDKARPERRKVGKGLVDFLSSNFEPVTGVTRESVIDYLKEKQIV